MTTTTVYSRYFIFLVLLYSCNAAIEGGSSFSAPQRSCISMTGIGMCEQLGYASITLPNHRGHVNKTEVSLELKDYQQLLDSGCSLYLRHFLCAYYAPMCEVFLPLDLDILPCTELCSHVRERCEPLLVSYNYTWPQHLNCELFPNKTQAPWCFGPPNNSLINEDSSSPSITPTNTAKSTTNSIAMSTADKPITSSAGGVPPSPSPHVPQSTVAAVNKSCDIIPSDSICSNLEYTSVTYPNTMGHQNKEEAEDQLQNTFNIAMMYTCSNYLIPLLCHYYHPECDNHTGVGIMPCREVCEEVIKQCDTSHWPKNFNCSILPSLKESNTNCTVGIPLDITDEMLTPATPTIAGIEEKRGGSGRAIATVTFIVFTVLTCIAMIM